MKKLIDGKYGGDIPKIMYQRLLFNHVKLDKEDWFQLSDPEDEGYWSAWINLLHKFEYYGTNGTYYLHQGADGSVYLATEYEIEREYADAGYTD